MVESLPVTNVVRSVSTGVCLEHAGCVCMSSSAAKDTDFPVKFSNQYAVVQQAGTDTFKYLEIEMKPAQFSLDPQLLWVFSFQRRSNAYSQPVLNASYCQASNYIHLLTQSHWIVLQRKWILKCLKQG